MAIAVSALRSFTRAIAMKLAVLLTSKPFIKYIRYGASTKECSPCAFKSTTEIGREGNSFAVFNLNEYEVDIFLQDKTLKWTIPLLLLRDGGLEMET